MLIFIDTILVGNNLSVWRCDVCHVQFEIKFLNHGKAFDPIVCPNCGTRGSQVQGESNPRA